MYIYSLLYTFIFPILEDIILASIRGYSPSKQQREKFLKIVRFDLQNVRNVCVARVYRLKTLTSCAGNWFADHNE